MNGAPIDRYLPSLSEGAKRWARFAAVLLAMGATLWLALALSSVLLPIAAGLAIAYILNPLITLLERRCHVRRVFSIGVGFLLLLGLGGIFLFAMSLQMIEFASSADDYAADLSAWLSDARLLQWIGLFPASAPTSQPIDYAALAREHGLTLGRGILDYATRFFSNVGYYATQAVLIPMFAFYFLLTFNEMIAAIRAHLPAAYAPTVLSVVAAIDRSISDFFRVRLVVCAIVGGIAALGWMILGVRYSLPLGALAGAFNLVPFLSVLALPPALVFAYLSVDPGESWVWIVSLTFAVFLLAQGVESFLLMPLFVQQTSGLHPMTTVVALLVGAEVGGVLGMLLAIPFASTLKLLAVEHLLPELRRLAQKNVGPHRDDRLAAPGPDPRDPSEAQS